MTDQPMRPDRLPQLPPFADLAGPVRDRVAGAMRVERRDGGTAIYAPGDRLAGLHLVLAGRVEIRDPGGALISVLGPGDLFGERGLMRDGLAATRARMLEPGELALLPAADFAALVEAEPAFREFFSRAEGGVLPARVGLDDLSARRVEEIMTPDPVTVPPAMPVAEVATLMRDRSISCVLVADADRLLGIATTSDLVGRILAEGRDAATPIGTVMTPSPETVATDALGHDAFVALLARRIGHFPVLRDGALAGIITRTNLLRHQALSSVLMISEIAQARKIPAIAAVVARIPQLLAQLVGGGASATVITRLVTDIADATTRRLLELGEAALGPPPVPYLWLACGSQGRREQTGVSDQDNCMILDPSARPEDDAYFAALARIVCDGLDACGYFYCPGEMMAVTPRWRQPLPVWEGYFRGWVERPDPMAQMLSSVMFDLRPIHGETALFDGLQAATLDRARRNSIFVAHMVANALKNAPPLGLLGGLSLIRSGAHKDTIDLKHAGVVPVVDLARVYALQGALRPVNTRERLEAAREAGVISRSGAHDLLDAYDVIAHLRLRHQSRQVRAGEAPDNFMKPRTLSDLERNHLRDAFVVIKTMQSALTQGRAAMT